MIHHVSLGTNDISRARQFYDPVLDLVGMRLLKTDPSGVHYGTAEILLSLVIPVNGEPASAGNGVHIALKARNRSIVRKFHSLALQHGGRSDGPPGTRPEYDANYFGAFVCDPDGNKVEAVTFAAE